MSEAAPEATETETSETEATETEAPDLAAEVEKWKTLSKKNEARAKENSAAAKRLAELEEAGKTEAEKAADRIAKAEAEVAAVPAKVAAELKTHLVSLHKISDDDAELFLTANEPELLMKQVTRLVGRAEDDRKKNGNRAPMQGRTPADVKSDEGREVVGQLFGGGE